MHKRNVEIEYKLLLTHAKKSLFVGTESLEIKQGYFNLNNVKVALEKGNVIAFYINNILKHHVALSKNDYLRVEGLFDDDGGIKTLNKVNYPAVRVRETVLHDMSQKHEITIKTKKSLMERYEEDIVITKSESLGLFDITVDSTITKTRKIIPLDNGLKWEVDFFSGIYDGLVIAEVEVPSVNTPLPDTDESWSFVDITDMPFLSNAYLAFNDGCSVPGLDDTNCNLID